MNWDGKIVAVIVSGYDGDGAAALCGIQEVGGITIAQKLDTAAQPDMPTSATESGCIEAIVRIAQGLSPRAYGARRVPSQPRTAPRSGNPG